MSFGREASAAEIMGRIILFRSVTRGLIVENKGLQEDIVKRLISEAAGARKKAYAPYSRFFVGAAVLAEDGRVFTGCNVENASYPAGSCAETIAVNKAVSEGVRTIKAVAIVGGAVDTDDSAADKPGDGDKLARVDDYIYPCGICRQVISEFRSSEGTIVIVARSEEDYRIYDISELLVGAFTLKQ